MRTQEAATFFEALSSDVRLDIFRLLVKHAPDGLVAGEIATQLDLPPTNLSFHLKAIVHTGLVSLEKEGRFSRYRANISLMLELIAYLTAECCSGHPEHCQSFRAASGVPLGMLPPVVKKKGE
jgi:DNA-binding transcriptional ArsR family regulator